MDRDSIRAYLREHGPSNTDDITIALRIERVAWNTDRATAYNLLRSMESWGYVKRSGIVVSDHPHHKPTIRWEIVERVMDAEERNS